MIYAVTASTPGRGVLLGQCVDSVYEQDPAPPAAHLVTVDHSKVGPSRLRNSMAATAHAQGADWLAFIDDDDVWLPYHLRVLTMAVTGETDVVYSHGRVEGRPGWDPQRDVFDADALLAGPNYIPMTGLVRLELFLDVGGFDDPATHSYEDWRLWTKMLRAGGRFLCIPTETWVYRFGDWDSRSKQVREGRR